MIKESSTLEYKENINKSFLKTVSAYANYQSGKIIFGIDDNGNVVGIDDIKNVCLNIENQINDSIKPKPDFSIMINDNNTITLYVKQGELTPYLYNAKAYKRNDTLTIEVGELEHKRLVLKGLNMSFEELKSKKQDLSFKYLEEILVKKLNLNEFNLDTLKNLNLYNDNNGYNNAAALLSDENQFPGLDIVVYSDTINEFKQRITLSRISILEQFFQAIELFKRVYVFEGIKNVEREVKEKIPLIAFREAIANSLIHRTWDINANTKVEMYLDKVVISSPGGLVDGISKEQYIKGSFSLLRNPVIGNVFYRVGLIEMFATGVKIINESYKDSLNKPFFDITNDGIIVQLPVIIDFKFTLNEQKVN